MYKKTHHPKGKKKKSGEEHDEHKPSSKHHKESLDSKKEDVEKDVFEHTEPVVGDFVVKKISPDDESSHESALENEDEEYQVTTPSYDSKDRENSGDENTYGYHDQKIGDRLAEIYENSDGTMPDMKTFNTKHRSRVFRAFVVFLFSCLFFGAIAWVGLFVLQPRVQFSEKDVILTVSGDEEVVSGGEVVYRVRYRNAQSVSLENVVLEVKYPVGFVFVTSSRPSSSEKGDTWNLGTIDPGSGGYIDITGKLFGDIEREYSIRTFLSYMPTNFTSNFQSVATKTVVLREGGVRVTSSLGDEVSREVGTPITFTITPTPGTMLENIQVLCRAEKFAVSGGSIPALENEGVCMWLFDKITQETVIDFTGIFGSEESEQDFVIEVRGWGSSVREGDGFLLFRSTQSLRLLDARTNISLVVNGGAGDTTIAPGETISASVVVQNKGDAPLTDVSVEMVLDGPSYSNRSILGWQNLTLTGDASVSGNQITPDTRRGMIVWNKQYVPKLASILPGEEVTFDIVIPVRSGDEVTLTNFTTGNIKLSATFSHGPSQNRAIVASNSVNLTLVSDFSLSVRNENVGKVHQVQWVISNSFHPLKNIQLEADFYGDVSIAKDLIVVPAGNIEYNEQQKRLIWKIPEMPTSVDVLSLSFEVTLNSENPTQKDLMSKVRMSAEDEVVGVVIKKVGDGIALR